MVVAEGLGETESSTRALGVPRDSRGNGRDGVIDLGVGRSQGIAEGLGEIDSLTQASGAVEGQARDQAR